MDSRQVETAAGVVHGLCSEVERISGQLQDARETIERQAAEIERLRGALDGLLRCSAYREFGQCGQCEQRARAALEPADD